MRSKKQTRIGAGLRIDPRQNVSMKQGEHSQLGSDDQMHSDFVADEITPKNQIVKRMSGQKVAGTMSSAGKPPKSIRSNKALPFSHQYSEV